MKKMDMDKTQKISGPIRNNKSIPSVCSNCGKIYRINTWIIEDGKRTGVSHGLCQDCFVKMKKGLDREEK